MLLKRKHSVILTQWIAVGVFIVFTLFFFVSPVHAITCTASVTPNSMASEATQSFTFSVTNTDGDAVNWIKFTRPNDQFTVTAGSGSFWMSGTAADSVTFTNGFFIGNTAQFMVTATAGSYGMESQNWTVQLSGSNSGSDPVTCEGSTGVAIVGPERTTLSIRSVAVTDNSSSSVTITFITTLAATSHLDYGLTASHGTTVTDGNTTTSHSFTISGLSENTTYHYAVTASANGSDTNTTDATFTTTLPGAPTSTPTPTGTIAPTPTPTPAPDRTKPVVTVEQVSGKSFTSAPTLSGTAGDNHDVASVEYSTDGKKWTRVKSVQGLTTTVATFSFAPQGLTNGNATVLIRAKDAAGNIGISKPMVVAIDTQGPEIQVGTALTKPFAKSPTIEGSATDPSGINTIQYSVDGGQNWQPVDEVMEQGKTTNFSFTPPPLDDGNYLLSLRSTDLLGNTSITPNTTFVIDRLPPRLGGILVHVGAYILTPDAQGTYVSIPSLTHQISLSLVGGPIAADLHIKNKQTSSEKIIPLQKLSTSKLWTADLSFPTSGEYVLSLSARDGAKNILAKEVANVHVVEEGQLTGGSEKDIFSVSVLIKDQETGQFKPWDAQSYGQINPIILFTKRSFSFFLPAGTYYLEVTSPWYQKEKTTQFTLTAPTPIHPILPVTRRPSISLLGFRFSLPSFESKTLPITFEAQPSPGFTTQDIPISLKNLPKATDPALKLPAIPGTKFLLTILNTWAPQTPAALSALENIKKDRPDLPIVILVPHESAAAIELFVRRGGYTLPFVPDPDGQLIQTIPYYSIPTHHLVANSGVIEQTYLGILTMPLVIH